MPKASESTPIYLRHVRTGRFFQSLGQWTDCRKEALAFGHGDAALRFVCEQNLQEVELFLVFADPNRQLRISLNRAC